MTAPPLERIELRCPVGPRKLFAMMQRAGQRPSYIHPDNLIEFSCYDCKRSYRSQGRSVRRVLHRYDLSGELIETLLVEE
jgi:hypothetical protein